MTNLSPISCSKNYGVATVGVTFIVFISSLLFAPFYFAGDQVFYGLTYESMQGLDLMEAYSAYPRYMSSKELVHFFVIFLTSGLEIEKNLVMAAINSLLAFFLMKLFEQWQVSLLVASLICITNFYMLVLYFAAERLKFGVLFFIASAFYLRHKKTSLALSILAVISHIQLIIPYAALLFSKFFSNLGLRSFLTFRLSYKHILASILVVAMAILIWTLLSYQILSKFEYYAQVQDEKNDPSGYLRTILLFGLTFLYTKKRSEVVLKFIPLFIAVYFLGGDGVNLFAYAIFMSYALTYKHGLNFGVLITSIYFAYKSADFIMRIIETGQGF